MDDIVNTLLCASCEEEWQSVVWEVQSLPSRMRAQLWGAMLTRLARNPPPITGDISSDQWMNLCREHYREIYTCVLRDAGIKVDLVCSQTPHSDGSLEEIRKEISAIGAHRDDLKSLIERFSVACRESPHDLENPARVQVVGHFSGLDDVMRALENNHNDFLRELNTALQNGFTPLLALNASIQSQLVPLERLTDLNELTIRLNASIQSQLPQLKNLTSLTELTMLRELDDSIHDQLDPLKHLDQLNKLSKLTTLHELKAEMQAINLSITGLSDGVRQTMESEMKQVVDDLNLTALVNLETRIVDTLRGLDLRFDLPQFGSIDSTLVALCADMTGLRQLFASASFTCLENLTELTELTMLRGLDNIIDIKLASLNYLDQLTCLTELTMLRGLDDSIRCELDSLKHLDQLSKLTALRGLKENIEAVNQSITGLTDVFRQTMESGMQQVVDDLNLTALVNLKTQVINTLSGLDLHFDLPDFGSFDKKLDALGADMSGLRQLVASASSSDLETRINFNMGTSLRDLRVSFDRVVTCNTSMLSSLDGLGDRMAIGVETQLQELDAKINTNVNTNLRDLRSSFDRVVSCNSSMLASLNSLTSLQGLDGRIDDVETKVAALSSKQDSVSDRILGEINEINRKLDSLELEKATNVENQRVTEQLEASKREVLRLTALLDRAGEDENESSSGGSAASDVDHKNVWGEDILKFQQEQLKKFQEQPKFTMEIGASSDKKKYYYTGILIPDDLQSEFLRQMQAFVKYCFEHKSDSKFGPIRFYKNKSKAGHFPTDWFVVQNLNQIYVNTEVVMSVVVAQISHVLIDTIRQYGDAETIFIKDRVSSMNQKFSFLRQTELLQSVVKELNVIPATMVAMGLNRWLNQNNISMVLPSITVGKTVYFSGLYNGAFQLSKGACDIMNKYIEARAMAAAMDWDSEDWFKGFELR